MTGNEVVCQRIVQLPAAYHLLRIVNDSTSLSAE